jgi:hypothetical protein
VTPPQRPEWPEKDEAWALSESDGLSSAYLVYLARSWWDWALLLEARIVEMEHAHQGNVTEAVRLGDRIEELEGEILCYECNRPVAVVRETRIDGVDRRYAHPCKACITELENCVEALEYLLDRGAIK